MRDATSCIDRSTRNILELIQPDVADWCMRSGVQLLLGYVILF